MRKIINFFTYLLAFGHFSLGIIVSFFPVLTLKYIGFLNVELIDLIFIKTIGALLIGLAIITYFNRHKLISKIHNPGLALGLGLSHCIIGAQLIKSLLGHPGEFHWIFWPLCIYFLMFGIIYILSFFKSPT